MTTTSGPESAPTDPIFDEPSLWRAEAVLALGLTGQERMAGVATGAAYPVALRPLVRHLGAGPGDLLCDIGAGLGGPAAFMAGALGADAIAVESSAESARQALSLFPELAVVRAAAEAVPLRTASCAAVTLLGVVSLIDDLGPLVAEVVRLLRPGGRLGLTDLCLVDAPVASPTGTPNTFRSLGVVVATLEAAGFVVTEISTEDADIDTSWAEIARAVDGKIIRRHEGQPTFAAWRADQERLGALIGDGRLRVGSLVALRPAPARRRQAPSVTARPAGGGGRRRRP